LILFCYSQELLERVFPEEEKEEKIKTNTIVQIKTEEKKHNYLSPPPLVFFLWGGGDL